MQLIHGLRFDNLKGDVFGGLTAAVVALPLALAFGVASGAGPVAGLYGAIFIGFFASLFGGTPAQVSGPTGPMTVVMAAVIMNFADRPALAFTVVIMGGLFQVLFGALRLGRYINLVPFPVISGFMSGIGCIIIALQLAPLLGHAHSGAGVVESLLALPGDLQRINLDAAAVALGTLMIVYLTPQPIQRIAPAPLIALVLGTAAVWWLLPGAPVLGEIPAGLPSPRLPAVSWDTLTDMIGSALILALLGAIDSLLTSLIADSVTGDDHDPDRELVGQGIGNMVAGLFGGIPGAGATMRTVVNVRSGGRTPLSGMLHTMVLLAVALGLGPVAAHVPHAVLAGILMKVGIDIIDWGYLRRVPKAPRAGVILMLLVMGLTVFVDLITAVSVGIVAASLLFVKRMSDLQLQSVRGGHGEVPLTKREHAILDRHPGAIMLYHMTGPMSFGAAKGLTRRVAVGAESNVLVLDLTEVPFVDTSAALAVEDIMVKAGQQGLEVLLVGLSGRVRKTLDRLGVTGVIPADHCFETRIEALRRAARLAKAKEKAAEAG
ncbi:MAG: SulP family inorganic anion transporter [Rhodospirillales bacterium]